ncbi:uncharacterized protein LOC143277777 [Babylonia areolata]|uniref:uncharacterized protein LOC143277777 n=1 Tax=Babylonia areolata TaxID=304850 RepID=UPI003FD11C62
MKNAIWISTRTVRIRRMVVEMVPSVMSSTDANGPMKGHVQRTRTVWLVLTAVRMVYVIVRKACRHRSEVLVARWMVLLEASVAGMTGLHLRLDVLLGVVPYSGLEALLLVSPESHKPHRSGS